MNNRIRNRDLILAAVLTLALVSMACGVNLNLPVTQIKTGPTQSIDILVPMELSISSFCPFDTQPPDYFIDSRVEPPLVFQNTVDIKDDAQD